jgi:dihydroflavonol-4-reductase
MAEKSRVFIIGGTGFIGSHTVLRALEEGYEVSILNRSSTDIPGLFPETVKIYKGDVTLLPDEKMEEMFRNHDVLVYAFGADDSYLPAIPAYSYFHLGNVETTERICRCAKKAGIKRIVILGSYFCHLNRIWPEMRLAEYHPYIQSRVEQEKIAVENSSGDLEIMVLELPYIFGVAKGRVPLWKPLVDYVLSGFPLFYMKGGSNMISVKSVAEAVLGAIRWGKGGECYAIGDRNLSWSELLNKILFYGEKNKTVKIVPDWLIKTAGALVRFTIFLQRKESGLHPRIFMRVQTREAFFDPAPAQKALHFHGSGLDEAIRDTVIACHPQK